MTALLAYPTSAGSAFSADLPAFSLHWSPLQASNRASQLESIRSLTGANLARIVYQDLLSVKDNGSMAMALSDQVRRLIADEARSAGYRI